jgi:hypothetical protein
VCHLSLPSSCRSQRGHIHLLWVLPLVGCWSKTPTVAATWQQGPHVSPPSSLPSLFSPLYSLPCFRCWVVCAHRHRGPLAADAAGPPSSRVEPASADRLDHERILTPSSLATAQAEVGPPAMVAAWLDLAPAGHACGLNGSSPTGHDNGEVGALRQRIDGGKAGGVPTAGPLDLPHGRRTSWNRGMRDFTIEGSSTCSRGRWRTPHRGGFGPASPLSSTSSSRFPLPPSRSETD